MAKNILVKPIITEKAEALSEKAGTYSFVVNRRANKVEIRKAVEEMYNVSVASVNTMVVPGKAKVKNTKTGVQKGMKSPYKKAMVTLLPGEEIDLFGDL
jgi:large subunit ribosomal protein L23